MSNDQPLINLSVKEWSKDQKLAITRASSQALTQSSLGEPWSTNYWKAILTYLNITQEQFVSNTMTLGQAIDILSEKGKDIRIDIMLDLIGLSLYGYKKKDMNYDSRSRRFLLELEHVLCLTHGDLNSVERSVSQQIYYALQQQEQASHTTNMDASAKKALQEGSKRNKALRWAATGAGILGGGAVIALTGGLAAPLLAPFLVGITGASFFATAGGVALVTSLFGLTGDSENEIKAPWELAFGGKHGNNNDIYCLEYETKELLELGYSFRKFVRDSAAKYAGMEIAKTTFLKAVFADVIDNPWQIAVDRSKKAGLELHKRGCVGLVDHVVLMGAPISSENIEEWNQVQSVVSGEFVNCYTSNDWVLAFVYRLHSFAVNVAGLEPVKIGRIRNFEVSEVDGHTKYPEVIKDILDQINLE
ncbi:hypothetical protein RO3G_01838 [Rhizopus delemar RA 99-880]|uniref:DUF726 domain-containing protein n=1 Tax=Rhizopus delemar (strain RA 99-880 / ATCC MYA-4621 / FGSC 9543 / NRRL 43880) TaxID=246409 RepID=I1BLQ4_RHIO9|nr:hypothetical protein RO3G_01838 [Rhizopus delemar RA 99-880]|eukprot:EIE77134.1 hypothetical protein RO3G_01838 [Rhizopus delemar RA 99-880]